MLIKYAYSRHGGVSGGLPRWGEGQVMGEKVDGQACTQARDRTLCERRCLNLSVLWRSFCYVPTNKHFVLQLQQQQQQHATTATTGRGTKNGRRRPTKSAPANEIFILHFHISNILSCQAIYDIRRIAGLPSPFPQLSLSVCVCVRVLVSVFSPHRRVIKLNVYNYILH